MRPSENAILKVATKTGYIIEQWKSLRKKLHTVLSCGFEKHQYIYLKNVGTELILFISKIQTWFGYLTFQCFII